MSGVLLIVINRRKDRIKENFYTFSCISNNKFLINKYRNSKNTENTTKTRTCEDTGPSIKFSYWSHSKNLKFIPSTSTELLSEKIYWDWSTPKHQPKNKLEKWFIISGDGVRPSLYTYVRTKHTTNQRVKPLFKLLLWLVPGHGSLYGSSLVQIYMDMTGMKFETQIHFYWNIIMYRVSYIQNSWNSNKTRQESSMIHSASPTVPSGIDCRLIFRFWDGRKIFVKIVITTGQTVVGLVDKKKITIWPDFDYRNIFFRNQDEQLLIKFVI